MKIIDFEKNGNVVRFFYGRNDCKNYHGDDWNDYPYESNAGHVYPEFVRGYVDVAFDMGHVVMEPQDDWHHDGGSGYCKDDMKDRDVPCIIVVEQTAEPYKFVYPNSFSAYVGSDNVAKIYFGDDISMLDNISGSYILKSCKFK
jgi:hypothetical protein